MPTIQRWSNKQQRYVVFTTCNTLATSLTGMRYSAGLPDKLRIWIRVYYSTNKPLCVTRKPLVRGKGRLGHIKDTNYNKRTGYTYLVELIDDKGSSQYEPPSSILAFSKSPTTGVDYSWYDTYTWKFDGLPLDFDQYSRED